MTPGGAVAAGCGAYKMRVDAGGERRFGEGLFQVVDEMGATQVANMGDFLRPRGAEEDPWSGPQSRRAVGEQPVGRHPVQRRPAEVRAGPVLARPIRSCG